MRRYGPEGSFLGEEAEAEDLPYLPIQRWEIWNEENIVTFAADPEPKRFATLIRIAGRVIHNEAPGSKVIVGGLFGRPLQIPPNVASGDFLSRLYRARHVKQYFDGVALHPYVADARAMGAQLTNLRRIMRRHGDGAHAALRDRAGLGIGERPDPLAARPLGPGRTSSPKPSRCSPPTASAGGSRRLVVHLDRRRRQLRLLPLGRAADLETGSEARLVPLQRMDRGRRRDGAADRQ